MAGFQPINNDHSVKEAVATIFIDNSNYVIDDLIRDKLSKNLESNFPSVVTIQQVQHQLNLKEPDNSVIKKAEVVGFKFSDTKIELEEKKIFQIQKQRERLIYSYHSLSYDRWDSFKAEFLDVFSKVEIDGLVSGVSITFIDDFRWDLSKNLSWKIDKVLKMDNSYFPKNIFTTKVIKSNTISQDGSESFNSINNYDLSTLNIEGALLLRIVHNAMTFYKDSTKFDLNLLNDKIRKDLDKLHFENKEFLFDVLTDEMLTKINLTGK